MKIKKIILLILGFSFLIVAIYYGITAIKGTIQLTTNHFNENEKGRLILLLLVNYFIVVVFSIISFFSIKKGVK